MQIRNIGELLPHSYKQKMNIVMMSLTSPCDIGDWRVKRRKF